MKYMKRGSQKDDVVLTPHTLAQKIISHLNPQGVVLDPCRGEGAFDHPLVTDWCEITEGRDFLQWRGHADWIIGNPPWSQYNAFNQHALQHADNIAWLYHLPGLLTKRRLLDAKESGHVLTELILIDTPPKPWPQSGFQVAVGVWRRLHNVQSNTIAWMDWRE